MARCPIIRTSRDCCFAFVVVHLYFVVDFATACATKMLDFAGVWLYNANVFFCGSIAQLGERYPYKVDVTGSSPVVSTTQSNLTQSVGLFFYAHRTVSQKPRNASRQPQSDLICIQNRLAFGAFPCMKRPFLPKIEIPHGLSDRQCAFWRLGHTKQSYWPFYGSLFRNRMMPQWAQLLNVDNPSHIKIIRTISRFHLYIS